MCQEGFALSFNADLGRCVLEVLQQPRPVLYKLTVKIINSHGLSRACTG